MLMTEYQAFARQGIGDLDQQGMCVLGCLGLAGESGEVVDNFKKALFHQGKPLDADAVILELGDVLWYVACLCTALGVDMGAVAAENQRKLRERYPDDYPPPKAPSSLVLPCSCSQNGDDPDCLRHGDR